LTSVKKHTCPAVGVGEVEAAPTVYEYVGVS
jgi:hypothetical protein